MRGYVDDEGAQRNLSELGIYVILFVHLILWVYNVHGDKTGGVVNPIKYFLCNIEAPRKKRGFGDFFGASSVKLASKGSDEMYQYNAQWFLDDCKNDILTGGKQVAGFVKIWNFFARPGMSINENEYADDDDDDYYDMKMMMIMNIVKKYHQVDKILMRKNKKNQQHLHE